jgi:WD40 repeat protein
MAPDTSWIASGGWDVGAEKTGQVFIYVFDGTGRLATRLGPLGNVVLSLASSHDGQYLAAALFGGEGLRVWKRVGTDLKNWQLVGEDKEYGGADVYGVAFGRAGELYTTAFDGKLRRYAAGYKTKPVAIATKGGVRPFSVAIHPAGDRVAVGYDDTTVVDVYKASRINTQLAMQLSRMFEADTKGVDNGDLSKVAWSTDGTRLYAAGRYDRGGKFKIRSWERAGRGAAKEVDGAINTIMHMLPCGNDIAMAATDPAFGLFGPDGRPRFWQENVQADMRGKRFEHFLVSGNAMRVRFGLHERSTEPVLFDLGIQALTDSPEIPDGSQPGESLHAGDSQSLPITDWINRLDPKYNGKPIELDQFERARSVAIDPDRETWVLGTEFWLRGYDRDGKLKWRQSVPGVVWGVNIPSGGKVVVAAYTDGTLRWHRLSDGKELLALFVHAKDRRWVLWTPTGYYTASPGGEELIGWHVNRGVDASADFFPTARFRDQFYRPDITKIVLNQLDENKAIEEANRVTKRRRDEDVAKRLPPVINIVTQDNLEVRGNEIEIQYTVRSPSKIPITEVRAFIDDRPTGEQQKAFVPFSAEESRLTLRVPIPPQDATVSLVAFTEFGASEPASIKLRWGGPKVREGLPVLYALVIGVAKYSRPGLDLKFAAKDADDFAAALKGQEGRAYAKVIVEKLTNEQATERNIKLGLEWLKSNVKTRNDRALVFFSGHGVTTPELTSYLLPQDVDPTKLIVTGLNKRVILDVLRGLPGKVLVFLDACHSGGGIDVVPGARRLDTVGLVNEFADAQNGIVSFVSSKGDQPSYERDDWKNGAFTSALVEALTGNVLSGGEKEMLTIDLYRFLLKRVRTMTGERQTPIMHSPPHLEPFAVALAQ